MKAATALAAMRELPLAGLDSVTQGAPALVLAPHPDDESLGCGGLIAEACRRGMPPLVVILTDGAGSHPASVAFPPERLRAVRQHEATQAARTLGLPSARLIFLGVPDTAAPHDGAAFDTLVAQLAELARIHGCQTILAPWRHDPHGDHVAANAMAAAVATTCGLRFVEYPVWGWTLDGDTDLPDPAPSGVRVDISDHLALKRRAIQAHRSQYAGLIADDPAGFQLQPAFLALFDTDAETFLLTA